MLLEDFGDDRNRRIHRVGDNKDECLGASGCNAGSKIAHDACVDLSKKTSETALQIVA